MIEGLCERFLGQNAQFGLQGGKGGVNVFGVKFKLQWLGSAFIADKTSKEIFDFSTEGSTRNIKLAYFANFRLSQQHTSRNRCKNK